jgi:Protein of unknown function (DUF3619)
VNTQNDQELAKKITTLLDQGTSDLRQGTVYKLQLARQAALARMATAGSGLPRTTTAPVLATAGGAGTIGDGWRRVADFRLWLGVLIIAGGAYYYDYWTILQQASEIAELDSALLGSDLPVDAFLDKGFENWLKRSGQ